MHPPSGLNRENNRTAGALTSFEAEILLLGAGSDVKNAQKSPGKTREINEFRKKSIFSKIKLPNLTSRVSSLQSADAGCHNQTKPTTMNSATEETIKIQIASAIDDCGTNEIRTIELTKAEEKEYNECLAKLAEIWG